MADFENIIYEVEDNTGWITLNRPERLNALSRALLAELEQALDHELGLEQACEPDRGPGHVLGLEREQEQGLGREQGQELERGLDQGREPELEFD